MKNFKIGDKVAFSCGSISILDKNGNKKSKHYIHTGTIVSKIENNCYEILWNKSTLTTYSNSRSMWKLYDYNVQK